MEPLASEEDFSCGPGDKEVEMDKAHFEGETMLSHSRSEGSAKSRRSQSGETNMTIKPCKVVLKNIGSELKPPHEYCLRPPKTKKLPQKTRNAEKMLSIRMLRAGLRDLWDGCCVKRPGGSPNPASLPENKKGNQMESGLVWNSSAKMLSKGTNTDHGVKKAEREASFPDSSALCSDICTKFSFIKSSPGNPAAGFCHAQENVKEAESLQGDPVLIPETQNTVSFEPTKKYMEHGKTLTEQTQRKESSHRTDMLGPICSGETSTDSTSQPSRTNSAGSSVPSLLCQFEPYLVSPLPGSALTVDLKDVFPRRSTVKRPVEGRMNQYSTQSSAEVVVQEKVTVGKLDALNQTRPVPRKEKNDTYRFGLERNEGVEVGGPLYATCEENVCQKMYKGDHSSDVPLSGCQSFPGDVTDIKHCEVRKETVLNGREVSSAEERGNSQPAKAGV